MMLTLVSRGKLWFTKWVDNNQLIGFLTNYWLTWSINRLIDWRHSATLFGTNVTAELGKGQSKMALQTMDCLRLPLVCHLLLVKIYSTVYACFALSFDFAIFPCPAEDLTNDEH